MKKINDFTEGKIFLPLTAFTLPILFAMLLQAAYGAVDLAIVGGFATSADTSAVSTATQLMSTATFVVVGFSMGTTILLGHCIGLKKPEEAGRIAGTAVALFGLMALMMTVLLTTLARPLTAALNAPAEAFDKTVAYIVICSAGSVFIVAYNLLGSIFRGIGDSKTPLIAVGIACVLNIGGDLLLVAVFDMGAAGAAIATVASQAISVVVCLFIIGKRKLPFDFSLKYIKLDKPIIARTLKLGAPVALQDLLVSISFLVILAIINDFGLTESAGIGVSERICAFIMLVPSAFMQALSAFCAQNAASGKHDRAKKAMLCGMAVSLSIGIILGYLSFFHGEFFASLFSKGDAAVAAAGADYLKAYAIDTVMVSFLFCFGGYFNGYGKTRFVMIEGIIGAFCVRIPVSYLMSRIEPISLFRVGLATPCSTVVQIIICLVYFIIMTRSMKKNGGMLNG